MDKERLVELKRLDNDVCAWWATWGGFKCNSEKRLEDSKEQLKAVRALIDAELARSSTDTEQRSTIPSTDNYSATDVQEAIEYYSETVKAGNEWLQRVCALNVAFNMLPTMTEVKNATVAVTALKAYLQKSEDEQCSYLYDPILDNFCKRGGLL